VCAAKLDLLMNQALNLLPEEHQKSASSVLQTDAVARREVVIRLVQAVCFDETLSF